MRLKEEAMMKGQMAQETMQLFPRQSRDTVAPLLSWLSYSRQ
jgi:hypothetical protein